MPLLYNESIKTCASTTGEHMKVTIREIAEAAGVSRGTVDRALNHRSGVNAEVAGRIIRLAEEMGYRPDMAAKTLANRRHIKTIGVLLCAEGNPFFDEVIDGVNRALEEMGCFGIKGIVKKIKGFDEKLLLEKIDELLEKKISGLVITPVNTEAVAKKIQELEENRIPVVTINTNVSDVRHLAYVGCDYIASGYVAGELMGMMSNGCEQHAAVVIGFRNVLAQKQRLDGIKNILEKEYKNIHVDAELENHDDDDMSYEIVKDLLQKNPQISAVCLASAGVEGGLKAIREVLSERKIRIITFDLTEVVKRNLSDGVVSATVYQEPFAQGYKGVEILGQYLLYGIRPENDTVKTNIFITTRYSL